VPRLERMQFLSAVDVVFDDTCQQFLSRGQIHEALYGLDRNARPYSVVAVPEPDQQPPRDATLMLPSPLREQADTIAAFFAEHHVHAAIHQAEAWLSTASGATVAQAIAALPTGPDPAVNRQEMLVVAGHWPREHVLHQRGALIRRQGAQPVLEMLPANPSPEMHQIATSWVSDLLPTPY
jgi:hypothetical protein